MAKTAVYHVLINTWDRIDDKISMVEIKADDMLKALQYAASPSNLDWIPPQEGEYNITALGRSVVLTWGTDTSSYYIGTDQATVALAYVRDRISMQE